MREIGYGYYGDKMALEDLKNGSVCIKESNGVRNIIDEYDIHESQLVFVNNIVPVNTIKDVIECGEMVRYKLIDIVR